jgi:hypothetical protein
MSEKIGKLHVVINTKGGVGKTTTSTIVASYLYEKSNKESKIKILEVDDNNNSGAAYCDSEIASFETFNVNVGVDKMQESLFETSNGKDIVIDGGGGNDTLNVLEGLSDVGIDSEEIVCYIPFLDDKADMQNVINTYNRIREIDEDIKIVFIMNRCKSVIDSEAKEQFQYFFGSDSNKVDKVSEDIENDKNTVFIHVLETNAFNIAQDNKITAYEFGTMDFDIKQARKDAKEAGKKDFKDILAFNKIYLECKNFYDGCLKLAFDDLDDFLEDAETEPIKDTESKK